MSTSLLISVRVGDRAYLLPRDQVSGLLFTRIGEAYQDERGRELLLRDLGPLLGLAAQPQRCHTLMVVLRRRSVGLRVDRADDLAESQALATTSLPKLIAQRQAQPWCTAVAFVETHPILVLDVRRIAADVALGVV